MSEHDADAVVERIARAWCAIEGDMCMSSCSYGKCAGTAEMISENLLRSKHVLAALKPGDCLPGGLVVVPEEPTEAMIEAAELWATARTAAQNYRAMIEAACDT